MIAPHPNLPCKCSTTWYMEPHSEANLRASDTLSTTFYLRESDVHRILRTWFPSANGRPVVSNAVSVTRLFTKLLQFHPNTICLSFVNGTWWSAQLELYWTCLDVNPLTVDSSHNILQRRVAMRLPIAAFLPWEYFCNSGVFGCEWQWRNGQMRWTIFEIFTAWTNTWTRLFRSQFFVFVAICPSGHSLLRRRLLDTWGILVSVILLFRTLHFWSVSGSTGMSSVTYFCNTCDEDLCFIGERRGYWIEKPYMENTCIREERKRKSAIRKIFTDFSWLHDLCSA